jgi:hypothetical protein
MSIFNAAAVAGFALSLAVNGAIAWVVWRLWRMEAPPAAAAPRHVRATLRSVALPPLLLAGAAALLALSFALSRFL